MPGYRLGRTDLYLGDAETGPSSVMDAAFNFIVSACGIRRLHVNSLQFRAIFGGQNSFRLDIGEPYHLAPLLGFAGNELAEIGGPAPRRGADHIGRPRVGNGTG